MSKKAQNIFQRDSGESPLQCSEQFYNCPWAKVAHRLFYLRPERFDRRKIWRIFRQEFNSRPDRLNRSGDGNHLMRGHIIHINNIAGAKSQTERLFDKEQQNIAIDRPWHAHRRPHAIKRQGSNGRVVLAPSAGYSIYYSHARFRTAIKPGQTQVRAHLVNEDEPMHIPIGDLAAKSLALAVVAFTGDEALFFRPNFNFCSARQIVAKLTLIPRSVRRNHFNSPSVASGLVSTAARKTSRLTSLSEGLAPPQCFGSRLSPLRERPIIFLINVTPT